MLTQGKQMVRRRGDGSTRRALGGGSHLASCGFGVWRGRIANRGVWLDTLESAHECLVGGDRDGDPLIAIVDHHLEYDRSDGA